MDDGPDIARFVRARLDEAGAVATAAGGTWSADIEGSLLDGGTYLATGPYGCGISEEILAHVLLHDPARVLRDIEAKRRIVEDCEKAISKQAEFSPASAIAPHGAPYPAPHANLAYRTLRSLAAEHDGHPDYLPKWKPKASLH